MTEAEQAAYERGRADERAAVVAWLIERAIKESRDCPSIRRPMFWAFLWAATHLFKFGVTTGKLFALSHASGAIERREHMKGTDNG